MFFWTEESMEWYARAAAYTGHFKRLAERIRPFLQEEDVVCDVGCGMGLIDTEIAPYVKTIIGIDREKPVLEHMGQRMKKDGISNVTSQNMDWNDLQQECCDTLLLCSFGGLDKYLHQFMDLCKRQLIMIKGIPVRGDKDSFGTELLRKTAVDVYDTVGFLTGLGISFQHSSFMVEFGQPFKDLEEARRFISHYRLAERNEKTEDELLRTILETQDSMFPYYLPNLKRMVVVRIDKIQYDEWKQNKEIS